MTIKKPLKILIDIGHPAHIHYSRNAINILKDNGHEIIVTARNKKIIKYLLTYYNIPFINRGKGKDSLIGKLIYMISADFKLLKLSIKHKPDIFLSFSSPYAAQVAYFLRKPHFAFNDTEHTDIIHKKFTYPFSSVIITPQSYQNELGHKQVRFNNIDDGLYLHPNYFTPNRKNISGLNLKKNQEYVVVRFVSWNAYHDYGQSGLDFESKKELIELLSKKYKVLITSEGTLPEEFLKYQIEIPPEKMHDVLAFSALFVGESGTMASESSYLGVPAVYINSLPLMCYLKLEQEAGLLKHFKSTDGFLDYIKELIETPDLRIKSKAKSEKMKKNFINPTKFLVWFIENYPNSYKTLKDNPDFQSKFQ